jgi:hypothetical protein
LAPGPLPGMLRHCSVFGSTGSFQARHVPLDGV